MKKEESKDFSKSILNNSFVRFIDWILLALCTIIVLDSKYYIKPILIIPCVLFSSFLICYNYGRIKKNVYFFEWDYTERKKRERFLESYLLINGFFSILFTFCIAYSFIYYIHNNILFGASLLPVFLCLFNMVFTVSIWYTTFEDDLTISYKIQKKPANWQETGREITPEDEYEEIMRRDFGI